jgi:hypothetical protein
VHKIRNPKYVASASIAGHRYGFVCIARRWLDLEGPDFLVVEGNEDVDLVEHSSGNPVYTEVQYKHVTGTFGPGNKLVHGALARFLQAWSTHRIQKHVFRGVLCTTARFTERRKSQIGSWLCGNREATDLRALQREVTQLLRRSTDISPDLLCEISRPDDFLDFMSAVSWQTGRPGTPEEMSRLHESLEQLAADLNAGIATQVVVERVARAATTPSENGRRLTQWMLWECLNDATLDTLAASLVREHLLQAVAGSASSTELRASCLVIGSAEQFARLADTSSRWAASSDQDLAVEAGKALEFVCYVAICNSDRTTKHCSRAVWRQVRFLYPNIAAAHGQNAVTASRVARAIARRCISYETRGRTPETIAPFVAKVRWLRLSTGEILTAQTLLIS